MFLESTRDKASILVVDADERHRATIRGFLTPEFGIMEAAGGKEALDIVDTSPIDLVLLDLDLVGPSAVDLCRALKARSGDYLPVLMLSPSVAARVLDDQVDRTDGLEAGADDFLTKPLHRRELTLRVRCFLRLREHERNSRQTLEQLHELVELKDDLVSLMVHDLRNPLSGVLGFMHVLEKDITDPGQRENLAFAIEAGHKLDETLGDLLKVRLLEEGRLVLDRLPESLRSVVEGAISSVAGDALDRHVAIVLSCAAEASAIVDAKLLRRAVENLLSNALKYSMAETAIDVSVLPSKGGVEIAVADRGPGIPDPAKMRLFRKFGAVVSNRDNSRRSHGLGLYLVRLFIAAHQGQVRVEDRPGGGTVFKMWLPLQGTHPETSLAA